MHLEGAGLIITEIQKNAFVYFLPQAARITRPLNIHKNKAFMRELHFQVQVLLKMAAKSKKCSS